MLRAPGSLGRARGGPAKAVRGSVRPEMPRWPAIARGRPTGCGCSGPNSGERKGVATRARARGPTLYWGGAPAGSGRGWIAAERRARGRAGAPGGGASRTWGLGVGGGYGLGLGFRRGWAALCRVAAVPLTRGPEERSSPEISGREVAHRGRRRGEEGTDSPGQRSEREERGEGRSG
jgi:hypothetical protein